MIAGVGFVANLTVETGGPEPGRDRRTKQQVVQPKPGAPRPSIAQVTPERDMGSSGCNFAQRIGPPHVDEADERGALRRLQQRTLIQEERAKPPGQNRQSHSLSLTDTELFTGGTRRMLGQANGADQSAHH